MSTIRAMHHRLEMEMLFPSFFSSGPNPDELCSIVDDEATHDNDHGGLSLAQPTHPHPLFPGKPYGLPDPSKPPTPPPNPRPGPVRPTPPPNNPTPPSTP